MTDTGAITRDFPHLAYLADDDIAILAILDEHGQVGRRASACTALANVERAVTDLRELGSLGWDAIRYAFGNIVDEAEEASG